MTGYAILAAFTLAAAALIIAGTRPERPHPVRPRTYRPHPHSDPYSQPPWGPAPRPDRLTGEDTTAAHVQAREQEWRIEDLMREPPAPKRYAHAPAGCSVFPAHDRGVA